MAQRQTDPQSLAMEPQPAEPAAADPLQRTIPEAVRAADDLWVGDVRLPGAASPTAAGGDAAATLSRHLDAHCFAHPIAACSRREHEEGAAVPLRVVTWNVWFDDLHAERRWSALLAEALSLLPDVLCLQEVTVRASPRLPI